MLTSVLGKFRTPRRCLMIGALSIGPARLAAADCPVNILESDCCSTVYSTEPILTQDWTCDDSRHFEYNLPAGTSRFSGSAGQGCCCNSLTTTDLYRVVGLAPSQPLTFWAELEVDGQVSGGCVQWPRPIGGSVHATLKETDANQASQSAGSHGSCNPPIQCCAQPGYLDAFLRIKIDRAAEEVFPITVHLSGGATNASWQANAILRFTGLPPGASVVSCQGFRQDAPVASLPSSWGDLKVRYR